MRTGRGLALALVALSVAACDDVPRDAVTSCEAAVRVGAARTDILFVIDDSGSMSEEQDELQDSLGAFVDGLVAAPIRNDFQIGVTTTAVSDFGGGVEYAFPSEAPAALRSLVIPYPAGRLVAVDPAALGDQTLAGKLVYDPGAAAFGGARILPASSETLVADFKANVLVGTWGTGKEQPLRAARLALEAAAPGGANEGFLRDGARLAIVFVTDEDDCSESSGTAIDATSNDLCHSPSVKAGGQLDAVADFAAFLDGPIAGATRRPAVAVIAGFDATLEPRGCARTAAAQSFDDPTRLAALADALGPARSVRASICDASFAPALEGIADLLVPQEVPLEGTPPDPRMLVVTVTRAGEAIPCPVAEAASPEAAAAGALYAAPREGRPATLTFQGACTLRRADQVDLRLVCAG